MNRENKYHYDLKNVHYVPGVFGEDGSLSYDKPIHLRGAMSMDISAEGETSKTRADGMDYIVVTSNNGYSGTLTMVNVQDDFKINCLGEKVDDVNGIQYEDANVEPRPFALMFEFVGDAKNKRHILYNNIASRVKLTAENKENQKEPDTEELDLTTSPALFTIDGELRSIVKGSTTESTKPEVYKDWFNRVYIPDTDCSADTTLKTLSINTVTLSPAFDKDVHSYTTTTNTATNTVTAEANAADASVTITVNGSTITSGGSATWRDGDNTVSIRVTNGNAYSIYNIDVTKEAVA